MKIKKSHDLPLDEFINLSLYNKKFGYYMKKDPFGKQGDFITAPNVSRLFSEMIAIWIVSFWENLGMPKKFNLVELGAGNGEMMKIMIESFKKFPSFLKSCSLIIHEKSPVFVHCFAAVERSPLLCLTYLIKEKNMIAKGLYITIKKVHSA